MARAPSRRAVTIWQVVLSVVFGFWVCVPTHVLTPTPPSAKLYILKATKGSRVIFNDEHWLIGHPNSWLQLYHCVNEEDGIDEWNVTLYSPFVPVAAVLIAVCLPLAVSRRYRLLNADGRSISGMSFQRYRWVVAGACAGLLSLIGFVVAYNWEFWFGLNSELTRRVLGLIPTPSLPFQYELEPILVSILGLGLGAGLGYAIAPRLVRATVRDPDTTRPVG